VTELRSVPTADLAERDLETMRALFDAAWPEDEYSDADWRNLLGGLHVLLEVDGRLASHAAVVERELRIAGRAFRTGYVEAVATWPELQGRGYGTRVMRAVNEHIAEAYEIGGLATGRQPFYERLGWERWRGPTSVRTTGGQRRTAEEDGYVMVLRTPTSPPSLDPDAPISCEWREGDVW
jgi:aminoglycoside 2'-N-acetyltransferase I